MIIKSMSRKEPSFGQLINYMGDIEKSDEQYNVYQNLFSRKHDDLEAEFQQNASHIPKRKNGVYMYHEILSIQVGDKIERKAQKGILRDIAQEYVRARAARNLAFGTLHDDHDEHLHYHLLISSNAAGESKKTRLSKAEFDRFKKSMEKLVLDNYPELDQKVVINREAGEKLSQSGAERKRRTGETPKRDEKKAKLESIFENASDKQDLFEKLSAAGMEFYARGKTLGVKDLESGRKHRLKTLGLLDSFEKLSDRVELAESAKEKTGNKQSKTQSPAEEATSKRKEEMDAIRAEKSAQKDGASNKNKPSS